MPIAAALLLPALPLALFLWFGLYWPIKHGVREAKLAGHSPHLIWFGFILPFLPFTLYFFYLAMRDKTRKDQPIMPRWFKALFSVEVILGSIGVGFILVRVAIPEIMTAAVENARFGRGTSNQGDGGLFFAILVSYRAIGAHLLTRGKSSGLPMYLLGILAPSLLLLDNGPIQSVSALSTSLPPEVVQQVWSIVGVYFALYALLTVYAAWRLLPLALCAAITGSSVEAAK